MNLQANTYTDVFEETNTFLERSLPVSEPSQKSIPRAIQRVISQAKHKGGTDREAERTPSTAFSRAAKNRFNQSELELLEFWKYFGIELGSVI